MATSERTREEIEADLDLLGQAFITGQREIDAEFLKEGFLLVLEIFGIKIEIGLGGTIKVTAKFVEDLLGPALAKLAGLGEKGEEVASKVVSELLGKIMFFIMLMMSWASFGLIPAPPSIEVVMFFYEWLRSLFREKEELENQENQQSETNTNTSGGNIV